MPGTKRAAEDSGPTTRSGKTAKTDKATSPGGRAKKGGRKGGAKATLPVSAFKAKALPLHVNITHTPASITDDDSVPAANADPGFLGSVTLTASSFSTGSYGWKGSKRLNVVLQGDEKETVQVLLSINATVVGSKAAPTEGEEVKEVEEEKEEKVDEEKHDEDKADEEKVEEEKEAEAQ